MERTPSASSSAVLDEEEPFLDLSILYHPQFWAVCAVLIIAQVIAVVLLIRESKKSPSPERTQPRPQQANPKRSNAKPKRS